MKIQGGQIRRDVGTGEGSRGGRVIGHTSSGKPIYSPSRKTIHPKNRGNALTAQEHREAMSIHEKKAKEYGEDVEGYGADHGIAARYHALMLPPAGRKHQGRKS